MLTQGQLSEFVDDHIYLFKDQIQANTHHKLFIPTYKNQQHHFQPNHQSYPKPSLNIDIWNVNNTISHQDYIGPIISFQRKSIWTKNHHHTQNQKTQYKSIPKPNVFQSNQHQLTDLSLTVPNPTSNHKKNHYQSKHSSISKNYHTPQQSLFSAVKPYSFNQPNPKPQLHHPYQNYKNQFNHIASEKQAESRRRNLFIKESEENSQIRNSQVKRKHKIFSSSSKVSKQKGQQEISVMKQRVRQGKSIQNKLIDLRMSENKKVLTLPEQSRHPTPKHTKKNNDIEKMNKQFESQKIQEHEKFDLNIKNLQNHKHEYIKEKASESHQHEYMKGNNTEVDSSRVSISNNFVTISNIKGKKTKSRPNSQIRTLIETDYVPSPSELSTILKTIEKQIKEVRETRSTIQNRKNVYLKKLNQSIRYHEQNFPETNIPPNQKQQTNIQQSQFTNRPSFINNLQSQIDNDRTQFIRKQPNCNKRQFVPIHPRLVEPHLVSLENPAKVKFNYLDPKNFKYQF